MVFYMSLIGNYFWTEKYKPLSINEILGNSKSKFILNYILNSKINFNIILEGPNGSGKNTSFYCFLIQKYKNHYNLENILFFNVYDYLNYGKLYIEYNSFIPKCIKELFDDTKSLYFNFKVIIKQYCLLSFIKNYFSILYPKIIIFDYSENLTDDMQYFLKSIIDNYYQCYFVFSTKNKFKIINQIKSRCIIFSFYYIEYNKLYNYILNILKKEDIKDNNYISQIISYTMNNVEMSLILTQKSIVKKNIIIPNSFINKYFIEKRLIIEKLINYIYEKNIQKISDIIQEIIFEKNISYNELLILLLNNIIFQINNTKNILVTIKLLKIIDIIGLSDSNYQNIENNENLILQLSLKIIKIL